MRLSMYQAPQPLTQALPSAWVRRCFVFLHDVAGDFDALVAAVGWDHEVLVCGDDECVGEYKRLANSYAGMALLAGFGRSRREAGINYICDNLPVTWNVTQARSRLWRMLDALDAHGWCDHEIFVPPHCRAIVPHYELDAPV